MTEAERLAERLHPKDEFRNDMSEREIERLARKMCDYPEIRAPVQGFPGGIPWEMHMRAYEAYTKRWSSQVALINLYGRGCRGGFGTEELDGFIPGWRDELSERTRLLARIAALEEALRGVIVAANSFCDCDGDFVADQVRIRARKALGEEDE